MKKIGDVKMHCENSKLECGISILSIQKPSNKPHLKGCGKRKGLFDYKFYLILLFVLVFIFFISFISAQQNKDVWKYQGQSLEEVFNNQSLSNAEKKFAIEKAVLDGDIAKDDLGKLLDIAVSKGLINAEDKKFYLEDKGLWGFIKLRGSYYYGVLNQFSENFISKPLWSALSVELTWGRALFFFAVLFWVILFSPISVWKTLNGKRVSLYETDKDIYPELGFFARLWQLYKSVFFNYWWVFFLVYAGYLVLFMMPISGRVMQIITLEFLFALKDSTIWGPLIQSFVLGALISFVPYFMQNFFEYRKRTKAYKKKMEEIAAIEAMKISLKG